LNENYDSRQLKKIIANQKIIKIIVQNKNGSKMINEAYQHSELTGKIIGCAMEVHKILGNGFQEVIYQRALAKEMTLQGISFSREHEMSIYYKGEDIGTRRVDFFVEGSIMVELKAITQLEDVHLAQAINYLEAYKMEIGLLINFGNTSLQFKRVMKPIKK
jgi:GxxExxY protein